MKINKSYKILIISDPFPGLVNFFNGISVEDYGQPGFYQVIKKIDENNHIVHIIVPNSINITKISHVWKNTNIFAYKQLFKNDPLKIVERVRLGGLTLNFLLNVLVSVFYSIKLNQNNNFDLVVGHSEHGALAAYFVSKILHIPNITRIYGSTLLSRVKNKLVWYKLVFQLNRIIPFITPAYLYICTQDGQRSDIIAKYFKIPNNKFKHIMNGVDKPQEDNVKKHHNKIEITFIGHLQGWKQPMKVAELIPAILEKRKDVIFNFVGSGSDELLLRKFVVENQLEDFVKIHGRLSQFHKNQVLLRTDIYVSFYLNSNLSNTMLEAFAYGKAILTSNSGQMDLIIKNNENAILLPYWDFDLALEKLIWLIENAEERFRISIKAKKWAEENLLSWDQRSILEINYYLETIHEYINLE